MLSKCLSKVLDLPYVHAQKEAPSKLQDTFMFINGELAYIREVGETYLEVHTKESRYRTLLEEDVESLEVWLPKTGVYSYRYGEITGQVLLSRRPIRQWKRSFSSSFYEVTWFGQEVSTFYIDPTSWKDFWVKEDKQILFMDTPCGYVKDADTMICTADYLSQEMKDWAQGKWNE